MEYPSNTPRQDFQSPRGLPLPANDNRPSAPVIPFPLKNIERSVGSKAARSFAGLGIKGLLRLNPYVRLAWTIYDVYQWYLQWRASQDVPFSFGGPNWSLFCGSGSGSPYGEWASCQAVNTSQAQFAAKDGIIPWRHPNTQWYATFRGPANDHPLFPTIKQFNTLVVYRHNVNPGPTTAPAYTYVAPHTEPGRVVPNPAVNPSVPDGLPVVPEVGVPPMPLVPPQLDPFAVPVNFPMQPWKAMPWRLLPYRVPNPYRSPTEQPTWGPEPVPPPMAQEPAAPTVVYEPDGRVVIGAPPSLGRHGKGRGVKETKLRVNRAVALAIHYGGKATEAADAVDALYDALPDDVKPHVGRFVKKTVQPHVKAKLVYRHFDKIDWTEAIINLIKNEAEDRVIGYFGNKAKQAAKKSRPHGDLPIGFGTGPGL